MPSVVGLQKLNKETVLSALRKAVVVEKKARYADFQGKRSTFSCFMRQTVDRLCKDYPSESAWVTLRGLFREYPNMDVGTRIAIVKRAEDLLYRPVNEVASGIL